MVITTEEVKRIAKLIKLRFSEEELAEVAHSLTGIMDMIDDLNEVDCNNIEPLTSVCDMKQRLRTDEITSRDMTDQLFDNVSGQSAAFAKEIKCFIVPKVIE